MEGDNDDYYNNNQNAGSTFFRLLGKQLNKPNFKMSFPGRTVQRAWHLVDAKNQTVGRLASQIAPILKGKHKPTFLPNKDMGDHVVIVNAEKVRRNNTCVHDTQNN